MLTLDTHTKTKGDKMKKILFLILFISSFAYGRGGDVSRASRWTLISATVLESIYDVNVGAAATDNTIKTFKIIGDADSDGGATTSETITLTLTGASDPTAATWGFTSTQSAGYTFDKTINLSGTSSSILILETNNSASAPSLTLDGDNSGFYSNLDNSINVSIGGADKFGFSGNFFSGAAASSMKLARYASTATVPGIMPNQQDATNGIGGVSATSVDIIMSNVSILKATDTGIAVVGTATVSGEIGFDAQQTITLGSSATTFAATRNIITVTGDASGNTVASVTGALVGTYIFIFVDNLVTFTNTDGHTSDTFDLVGGSNLTSADDLTLTLVYDGTSWYETGRSAN